MMGRTILARLIKTTSLILFTLFAIPCYAAGTRHACTFVSTPGLSTPGIFASVSCNVAANSSGYSWDSTELPAPWMAAGTASNLSITAADPGVGNTRSITFRRSKADTVLTITLTSGNTTATDTTDKLTLSVGDLVDLKYTSSGTPSGTNISVSWTFDSSNTGESAYVVAPQAADPSNTSTNYVPGFSYSNNHWSSAQLLDPFPISGSITAYEVVLTAAPGTGKSWTAAWIKNGTIQDGTGGSTDTRLTISDAATNNTWTGTLSLSAGDTIELELVPASTPTSASVTVGTRIVATTSTQSIFCGESEDDPSISAVNYQQISSTTAHSTFPWNATESNRQATVGYDSFTLGNFFMWFRPGFSPGTSKSWTFDLRQNASSPANNPSLTISDSNTTGNDTTHTLTVSSGDLIDIRVTPTNTPSTPSWTLWCFSETASSPIASSFPALTVAP